MIKKCLEVWARKVEALKELKIRSRDVEKLRMQMPCFNQDLLLALIDEDQDYRTYQYGPPGAARIFDSSQDSTSKYEKLGQVSEASLQLSDRPAFSKLRCSQNPTKISRDLRVRLAEIDSVEYYYFDSPDTDGHTILQHFPYGQTCTHEVYTSDLTQQVLDVIRWNRHLYRDLGYVLDLTPTYPQEVTSLDGPFVHVPGLWVTRGGQVLVSSTTFLSNQGFPQEKDRVRSNMRFMTYLETQMGQPVIN